MAPNTPANQPAAMFRPRVRARFKCVAKEPGCDDTQTRVILEPDYSRGNEDWSAWTPSGRVELTITNPSAIERFEVGRFYFVDFTPAE